MWNEKNAMAQRLDFQKFLKTSPQSLAICYHWDCDGLATTALLLNFLDSCGWKGTLHLFHPEINYYFLSPEEFDRVRSWKADAIVTLDLNFPLSVIEELEQCAPVVFIFDHHEQTATLQRSGRQDPRVPGCSMLVNEYFGQPLSLCAVLGMVGDQEDRLRLFPAFYQQAESIMRAYHLDFATLLRITKLLDTLSMVQDDEGFEYGIRLLRDDPLRALHDARLRANEEKLTRELTRWSHAPLESVETVGDALLQLSITSPYHILSEVTRRLAKNHPDHILLVDQRAGPLHNLYVRRRDRDVDLSLVVELARKRGYNAGGKNEVAGVLLPSKDFATFRADVIALLIKHH